MKYNEIKQNLEFLDSPIEKLDFVMELGDSLEIPDTDINCYDISGCKNMYK